MAEKIINTLFGGQPQRFTYLGYGECPECGDDCAEFWFDESTSKRYVRCPYFMCDNWGELRELHEEASE